MTILALAARPLDRGARRADTFVMLERASIKTPHGTIAVTHFDNGDIRLWSPPGSNARNVLAAMIKGRGAYKQHNWYISKVHAQAVLDDLSRLD